MMLSFSRPFVLLPLFILFIPLVFVGAGLTDSTQELKKDLERLQSIVDEGKRVEAKVRQRYGATGAAPTDSIQKDLGKTIEQKSQLEMADSTLIRLLSSPPGSLSDYALSPIVDKINEQIQPHLSLEVGGNLYLSPDVQHAINQAQMGLTGPSLFVPGLGKPSGPTFLGNIRTDPGKLDSIKQMIATSLGLLNKKIVQLEKEMQDLKKAEDARTKLAELQKELERQNDRESESTLTSVSQEMWKRTEKKIEEYNALLKELQAVLRQAKPYRTTMEEKKKDLEQLIKTIPDLVEEVIQKIDPLKSLLTELNLLDHDLPPHLRGRIEQFEAQVKEICSISTKNPDGDMAPRTSSGLADRLNALTEEQKFIDTSLDFIIKRLVKGGKTEDLRQDFAAMQRNKIRPLLDQTSSIQRDIISASEELRKITTSLRELRDKVSQLRDDILTDLRKLENQSASIPNYRFLKNHFQGNLAEQKEAQSLIYGGLSYRLDRDQTKEEARLENARDYLDNLLARVTAKYSAALQSKRKMAELSNELKSCSQKKLTKVPDLMGKTLDEARVILNRLQHKNIKIETLQKVADPEQANRVRQQFPGKDTWMVKQDPLTIRVTGAYDKFIHCSLLHRDFRIAFEAQKNRALAMDLYERLKALQCPEAAGAGQFLAQFGDGLADKETALVPNVEGLGETAAVDKLTRAGLGFFIHHTTKPPDDRRKAGTVLSQKPREGGRLPPKAVVDLVVWRNFSIQDAIRDKDCKDLPGSLAQWNETKKAVECVCPIETIKVQSKSEGLSCVSCWKMYTYYQDARSIGNDERAQKIRKAAAGCNWAKQIDEGTKAEQDAQEKCAKNLSGSRSVKHLDGTFHCECPAGTVQAKTKSRGLACVSCQELESSYKNALSSSLQDRAAAILKIAQACPFSSTANQELQNKKNEEYAAQECNRLLPESRPVLQSDGRYRCDCSPKLELHTNGVPSCVSCEQLGNMVNDYGARRDMNAVSQLIAVGQSCSWHAAAFQQLQQQMQNSQACGQLHQNIQQACQNQQWQLLSQLYVQAGNIPSCTIDTALVTACTTAQAAQIASQFSSLGQQPPAQYPSGGYQPYKPPPRPGGSRPPAPPTAGGGTQTPQRPNLQTNRPSTGITPQVPQTNIGGKACYVIFRDIVTKVPAGTWHTKKYYCSCNLPADKSQATNYVNTHLSSPGDRRSILSGPHQGRCPAGSVPSSSQHLTPK